LFISKSLTAFAFFGLISEDEKINSEVIEDLKEEDIKN